MFFWTQIVARRLVVAVLVFHIAACSISRAANYSLTYDQSGDELSQLTASSTNPTILSQTGDQGVPPGGTAGFSVTAAGNAPLDYQWYFNNAPINSATNSNLLLVNVSGSNEGEYAVTVTSGTSQVSSTPAKLFLDANGNGIPDSWELEYIGNLNYGADADLNGTGNSILYDYENGLNPLVSASNVWIATSGTLDDPNNWSLGHVPTVYEEAVINSGSFSLPTSGATFTATLVTVNVPYTMPAGANQNLVVSGAWTFNGAVTLASGQQFAVGGTGSVTFAGPTNLNGANLYVYGGATLSASTVTTYTLPEGVSVNWQVQNDNSELLFPALTTIAGNDSPGCYLTLLANDGQGLISVPALTTITKPDDGDTNYDSGITLQADDGSLLSAPLLSTFSDNDNYPNSTLEASNSGVLKLPKLLAPKGVNNINLNDLSNPQQFTSLPGCGNFAINSGNVTMSNLDTIAGFYHVYIYNGANVSFPKATNYTPPADADRIWEVQNDGSVLNFPNLRTITWSNSPGRNFTIIAHNGHSLISFPILNTITKPDNGDTNYDSGITLQADDGSLLSAPALATFIDNDSHPNSSLNASNSGVLSLPKLLAPMGVNNINMDALSNPQQFTSLPGCGNFAINSGNVTMSNLDTIAGFYHIDIYNGANVSFPKATNYTPPADADRIWEVQNDGSVLTFPNLRTITWSNSPGRNFTIIAHNGHSLISFPILNTITKPDNGDTNYDSGITLQADDGSLLSAPALATFIDNDSHPNSSLNASNSGVLSLPKLLAPKGVNNINMDALSNPQQFTSLPGCGNFSINSGNVTMSNLDTIAGMYHIDIYGGAKVSFPNVVDYTMPAVSDRIWEVQNDGSELDFPNLKTITGSNSSGRNFNIVAHNGVCLLSMPVLTTITKPNDGDTNPDSGIEFDAENGATISIPELSSFDDQDSDPNSSLTAGNGGILILTSLSQPEVTGVSLNGITLPGSPLSLITSASTASAVVGEPFSYTIQATNGPLSFSASGLPGNLQVNSATGVISGTAATTGTSSVVLTASNAEGLTTANLTIIINPPAPVAANGLIYAGLVNGSGASASDLGSVQFTFASGGGYTVKLILGGAVFSSQGKLDREGNIPSSEWGKGIAAVSLTPIWTSTDEIIGTVGRANGNLTVPFFAEQCPYSAGNPLPSSLRGAYTADISIQNGSSVNPTLRGVGYFTLTVSPTGLVAYTGKASDGTTFSGGSPVTSGTDPSFFIYAPLYAGKGAIIGSCVFETTAQTDFDGGLNWYRPAVSGTGLFSAGWPTGLGLSVAGSHYSEPAPAKRTSPAILPLPGLPPTDPSGNVALTLNEYSQTIVRGLNLSDTGVFTVVTTLGTGEKLSLKLTPASGVISGVYQSSATGLPFALSGILLQKTNQAAGFALDSAESAPIDLEISP